MIQIPVVGQYDSTTKEKILADRGAVSRQSAINRLPSAPSGDTVFDKVSSIWPASSTYEIIDRYGQRFGSPWFAPIDLGDDVKLGIIEFTKMCYIQLEENQRTLEGVTDYLKSLISADLEIYKLMVKMGRLEGM